MSSRLFLIDGHALIFKMYYAFARRPMINSKGADMSILYGFTKYILEMIGREQPAYLAVAFDPPGGTFRNEMYPEYKANRAETPQLVIDALEPLTELCGALNIPVLMVKGYEADDVIGSVAKRFASKDTEVVMVTPDKDYGQLVDEHIMQLKPGKAGGEDVLLDKKGICEKYGISDPAQVTDMLAICGDTADNVPGVKGVGEVGAGKLVGKYGSLSNIYAHIGELSERQQAMFREAEGHIGLSYELVTIKTDVPVEISLKEMKLDTSYTTRTVELFEKYEFASLKKYLGDVKTEAAETAAELETRQIPAAQLTAYAKASGMVAVVADYEEEGLFSGIRKLWCCAVSDGIYMVADGTAEDFAGLLEDKSVRKAGHDLKRLCSVLRFNGMELNGRLLDISLMHYLINPEKNHGPESLAESYLGISLVPKEDTAAGASLFDAVKEEPRDKEAAVHAALAEKLVKEIEDRTLSNLYYEMEEPLLRVLAGMEYEGVKMDLGSLTDFAKELGDEIVGHEARVREIAGEPSLNVSSPKQIGEVLFEKLKLDPKAKKSSKGSWSTDETTLRELEDRSPIINEILEFRAARKLLSTYIGPFPSYVAMDGKIHTTLNQALTSTGRLSSSNPNLQNIPIRTERGKNIRKAFVSSHENGLIMSADYSQIELRIMAHLCGDAHMIEAFNNGTDVHAATASKIFKISHEDVTQEQRRIAKTANFGIMYGISPFGLSQRLGVSRSEAKSIIEDYFAAFPSIRTFIDRMLEGARKNGYVETIFGRRRYMADINAGNATIRALAERNAVNAPIQGSAADIIKLAMIEVARRMQEENFKSRMVLQIHDELLFDVFPEEAERLRSIVVDAMENIIKLSVPLTVECNYGKNWLEAH